MLVWLGLGAIAMAGDLLEIPALQWQSVDDGVMGGRSVGRAHVHDGRLVYEGVVSLENNGGFSSIRSASRSLGLAGTTGFRLTLEGDGKRYDFTVRRRDVRIRAGSWRAEIRTTGERQVVTIPLEAFEATSYGRPVPDAPSLVGAGEQIDSVGFLIGSKQAGPFRLEVLSIEALGEGARAE